MRKGRLVFTHVKMRGGGGGGGGGTKNLKTVEMKNLCSNSVEN